jgi:hypothetical protein
MVRLKMTQHLNLVRASVSKANVRALNGASYARNSAVKLVEACTGKRVRLATKAFSIEKVSRGRGKRGKLALKIALKGGSNFFIDL